MKKRTTTTTNPQQVNGPRSWLFGKMRKKKKRETSGYTDQKKKRDDSSQNERGDITIDLTERDEIGILWKRKPTKITQKSE